jgi:hypothetical protein
MALNSGTRFAMTVLLGVACSSDPTSPVDAGPSMDAAEAEASPLDATNDADVADVATDAIPSACGVEVPTACPTPEVRYADIAPIIERRCLVCHNGTSGIWPLNSHRHVADWQDTIRAAMLTCAMPPPESLLPMLVEERVALLTWIRCGALP